MIGNTDETTQMLHHGYCWMSSLSAAMRFGGDM
jgi:hypothetical protein